MTLVWIYDIIICRKKIITLNKDSVVVVVVVVVVEVVVVVVVAVAVAVAVVVVVVVVIIIVVVKNNCKKIKYMDKTRKKVQVLIIEKL